MLPGHGVPREFYFHPPFLAPVTRSELQGSPLLKHLTASTSSGSLAGALAEATCMLRRLMVLLHAWRGCTFLERPTSFYSEARRSGARNKEIFSAIVRPDMS